MEKFCDILNIARDNVRKNPTLQGRSVDELTLQYLKGLNSEVDEVYEEVREQNQVHLTDELSDIVWNYAVVLALLEHHGYIASADAVVEHGFAKYTERAPAFLEADEDMWDAVKAKQKAELKQRHKELYGDI